MNAFPKFRLCTGGTRGRAAGLISLGACALAAATGMAATHSGGAIDPRISPDGRQLVVSYQGMIARMPVAGGELTVLTHDEGWDVSPAWSADGTRIGFTRQPANEFRLINARDGSPVSLAKPVRGTGPFWFHPDGRKVLGRFAVSRTSFVPGWLDLPTGELMPVRGADMGNLNPYSKPYALSADGRWIYYAVHADRPGEQVGTYGAHADLFRLPVDGETPERIVRWPARIYGLVETPAGRGVLIVTDAGTNHNDIWHLPLDHPARATRKLTFGQADEDSPSALEGGQVVLYTDNASGTTRLVRHDLRTGDRTFLQFSKIAHPGPTGTLRLTVAGVWEKAIRVSVKRRGGKFFAPRDALYRTTAGLGHFYLRGETRLEVPAGDYEVRAFHGPEFRPFFREVTITAGGNEGVSLNMVRWINLPARGWYSGENHIHANYGYGAWYNTPETILDQVEGEDLHVANVVVANSDGEGVFDREFFSGAPHPLSTPEHIIYWNQEFRSTSWGHMTLFHLPRLVEPIFTGFAGTTNPWDIPTNADIAARTNADGGVVSYTHPTRNAQDPFDAPYAAKGLPVDAAVGHIDVVDVMGSGYSSSLGFWYRLLNCGFRLPAAAGTDCFLNRVASLPPGYGRVYVHLPSGLTYEGWVEGLKAGRAFVTNGPILEFSVNGRNMGDTLELPAPGNVRVRGRVEAQFPLAVVEVIFNGNVLATVPLAADKLSATLDREFELPGSGWIALRAGGPAVPYWPGGERAAHSNPVYIEVAGRPFRSETDAEYFLGWIDRLEALLNQRDRMHTGRAHIEAHLNKARAVYRRIAEQGAN